jgi:hypothetical protein
MKGGVTLFRGVGQAARRYLESDRSTADEYYLDTGTVLAKFAFTNACGEMVAERSLAPDKCAEWVDWTTFFHRVFSVSGGEIRTKGDLNTSIDPWTLHSHNLIGTEFGRIVGIGWLIESLPILLVGGLILQVVTHYYVLRYWRFPVRVLGWSVLVSLAVYLIKPFVRAVLLSQIVRGGRATSSLVPTGLFGLHAQAVAGSATNLRPGQAGSVVTDHVASSGLFEIDLSPSLGFWAWLLLILVWLIPATLCVIYALRRP